jgi:hypothetical protein
MAFGRGGLNDGWLFGWGLFFLFYFGDKPIACLWHRANEQRIARVVSQRLADLLDAVDQRIVADRSAVPDNTD